jgi:Rieske Fe-S protein
MQDQTTRTEDQEQESISIVPTQEMSSPTQRISRRTVIVAGGAVVAVGLGMYGLFPLIDRWQSMLFSPQATSTGQQGAPTTSHADVIASTSDIPLNSAHTFMYANGSQSGIAIHLANGNFVAYNRTCSHGGVYVDYDPATHFIVCPAHGSKFDPAKGAAVVAGPAAQPLTALTIRVNADGTITMA